MRFFPDVRAQRLLRRLPDQYPSFLIELASLGLLAWCGARLFWSLTTPLGPVGDWRGTLSAAPSPPATILGASDPFFHGSAGGLAEVTGMDLKLFGVRQDRASGRGSAIIGLPDGRQTSVVVGEAIVPGVTLEAVDFDSVTLGREGRREMLFLDQSKPAAIIGEAGR